VESGELSRTRIPVYRVSVRMKTSLLYLPVSSDRMVDRCNEDDFPIM
jgi:hypothetical protein